MAFAVCFLCACVCGRRRCSCSQPPSSASLFGEDFVRAGRRSMNASAEVFPSPPALAKQEQLLLGKKKKSSWSFKRHGITLSAKSCPVRHWDFTEKSKLCCSSFVLYYEELWLWICLCSERLPRPGPFVRNFCGIVLCCCIETRELNTGKKVIVLLSSITFLFHQIILR